jgi:gamma-glutamyltranspeptidase/glutathione hydrolase
LARLTADFYERQKGLLRFEDFAGYQAEEAAPIKTTYKEYEVYQCAPNSQGIVLLLALNILEGFNLQQLGHNSADYIHVVTEALKLAFADRDRYIADPRFAKHIPVDALLSKDYATKRRGLIHMDQAIQGAAPPGDPQRQTAILQGQTISYETTHQTAVLIPSVTSPPDHRAKRHPSRLPTVLAISYRSRTASMQPLAAAGGRRRRLCLE